MRIRNTGYHQRDISHLILGDEHQPEVGMDAAFGPVGAQAQVHISHTAQRHVILYKYQAMSKHQKTTFKRFFAETLSATTVEKIPYLTK
jgi:hypothetical protein